MPKICEAAVMVILKTYADLGAYNFLWGKRAGGLNPHSRALER